MAQRFSSGAHTRHTTSVRIVSAGIFLLIVLVFFLALGSFGEDTLRRQKQSLETAMQRDVAQCYALEGIYPPSLSYLEEHYGLTYDHDTFTVDYRSIGSNLYPEYTVLENH